MNLAIHQDVACHGQETIVIQSPTAAYWLQRRAGGLASLIDRDGNDWISFRPGGGSGGEYRGIPNCGQAFHPGYPLSDEGVACTTSIELAQPDHIRITSNSVNGQWQGVYDFLPTFARFTILKAGGPYWFLYEGTPGGKIELDRDFYILPDGRLRPIAEDWEAHMPPPRWVYFGKRGLARGLFMVHHQEPPADVVDQFWQMQGKMTVWGFGRRREPMKHMLTTTPQSITFGLLENADTSSIVTRLGRIAGSGR
jgi:hypothetical protein